MHNLDEQQSAVDEALALLTATGQWNSLELGALDGTTSPWPTWLAPELLSSISDNGPDQLWQHQRRAIDALHDDQSVVITTPPASGKSWVFWAPALHDAVTAQRTTLYIAPTKALIANQVDNLSQFAPSSINVAAVDGDSSPEHRRWARQYAHMVAVTPDVLHASILTSHRRWARFLSSLSMVVVDEAHHYRGTFGAHVALMLRRLHRVCAWHRSSPRAVVCSATLAHPDEHAETLVGPLLDTSGYGVLYLDETDATMSRAPRRLRSLDPLSTDDVGRLIGYIARQNIGVLAFVQSQQGAEYLAEVARREITAAADNVGVEAYRGGLLPEARRGMESRFRSGETSALVATSALELGVDIPNVDCVIIHGWPGTSASLWQQAGRAGRHGNASDVIFIPKDDPLDRFFADTPSVLWKAPTDHIPVNWHNPKTLSIHLCLAAHEVPLGGNDLDLFGPNSDHVVKALVARGVLRPRRHGWFWAYPDAPLAPGIRSVDTDFVEVVEASSGQMLSRIDTHRAWSEFYRGAITVHTGQRYRVIEPQDDGCCLVERELRPNRTFSTVLNTVSPQPNSVSDHEATLHRNEHGDDMAWIRWGGVEVTSVISDVVEVNPAGAVVTRGTVVHPARTMTTHGLTIEGATTDGSGQPASSDAIHAAEHFLRLALPLVVTCDRSDVGWHIDNSSEHTDRWTIHMFDQSFAGAGTAEEAFRQVESWFSTAVRIAQACPCTSGCARCLFIADCERRNTQLDKAGAIGVLTSVSPGR